MTEHTDPTTVSAVDLARYAGLWYEIGRLPLRWEPADASDVTAEYTVNDDDTVTVDNRCLDDENEPTQSLGRARVADDDTAKLRVSFLPEFLRWIPFTEGDYWILKLDDAYRTALVGSPDRKYLWLLHRKPHLDDDAQDAYLSHAREQGYDLAAWIATPQSGGRVTDEDLSDDD